MAVRDEKQLEKCLKDATNLEHVFFREMGPGAAPTSCALGILERALNRANVRRGPGYRQGSALAQLQERREQRQARC